MYRAFHLVRLVSPRPTLLKRVRTAIGMLLSFDLLARGGDLPLADIQELREPKPGQRGAAAAWTLTLFPVTAVRKSKTLRQDLTHPIGGSHPDRTWLSKLCPLLRLKRRSHDRGLLSMTLSDYNQMVALSSKLTGLAKMTPHQLRHGGASADALNGNSDMAIQERGNWASEKSVLRYRSAGRYLRSLNRLSNQQTLSAQSYPDQIVALCRCHLS